ncbi:MAG: hypothetical protein HY236_04265 [Acidobacteria bacterium]|nr:hypothetical protein [Acidobacteriota bacterium]
MNYFNYFTEIEEHFQKARGTGLFLLSPLDWALVETWKESGAPLEVVLKGIDRTFEKWQARKHKTRMVNSLAYCAQEVLEAAQGTEAAGESQAAPPGFPAEEVAGYLRRNAAQLRLAAAGAPAFEAGVWVEAAETLEQLAAQEHPDLEVLEQRLTALEERIKAAAVQARTGEELFEHRREMDRQLAPYRRKMTAEQLAMLEKQYLDRKVMEAAGLPRLSLFYL